LEIDDPQMKGKPVFFKDKRVMRVERTLSDLVSQKKRGKTKKKDKKGRT